LFFDPWGFAGFSSGGMRFRPMPAFGYQAVRPSLCDYEPEQYR
jgi:hypothetical protein